MSLETADDFDVALADWGETIGFLEKEAGAERTLKALVDREPPQPLEGAVRGKSSVISVRVHNSRALGIASEEIDSGLNRIRVSRRLGESSDWMPFRIVSHDARVVHLEVVG